MQNLQEITLSNPYAHTFNGMEKNDEIKGRGNSLDFGARMYDSRLGRWLSIDPYADRAPDMSPYAYVLNNPIRFLDVGGKWPGDSNLMIVLDGESEPGNAEMSCQGDWTVIKASSLDEALEILNLHKKSETYDNLAIVAHGKGQGKSWDGSYTKTSEYVRINELDLEQYNDDPDNISDEMERADLDALSELSKKTTEGANILFYSCGVGASEEYRREMYKLVDNAKGNTGKTNLYLSSSNQTATFGKVTEDLLIKEKGDVPGGNLAYGGFKRIVGGEIQADHLNLNLSKDNQIWGDQIIESNIVLPEGASYINNDQEEMNARLGNRYGTGGNNSSGGSQGSGGIVSGAKAASPK